MTLEELREKNLQFIKSHKLVRGFYEDAEIDSILNTHSKFFLSLLREEVEKIFKDFRSLSVNEFTTKYNIKDTSFSSLEEVVLQALS